MKISQLREIIKSVMQEITSTGTGAASIPGEGSQIATRYFVSKDKTKKNKATKYAEKLGYKVVKRPKRPSSTKLIDYLQ